MIPRNPRKLHAILRPSESNPTVGTKHSISTVSPTHNSPRPGGRSISPLAEQIWLSDTLQTAEQNMASCVDSVAEQQALTASKDDSWSQTPDCDEGENSAAYAAVLEDNVPGNETVPFYVGTGFFFSSSPPSHCLAR